MYQKGKSPLESHVISLSFYLLFLGTEYQKINITKKKQWKRPPDITADQHPCATTAYLFLKWTYRLIPLARFVEPFFSFLKVYLFYDHFAFFGKRFPYKDQNYNQKPSKRTQVQIWNVHKPWKEGFATETATRPKRSVTPIAQQDSQLFPLYG